jgi:hypothetical protein
VIVLKTLGIALVVALVVAAPHEKGTLKLAVKSFRAGDSLAIAGAKFSKKDELTLALVGVSGRIALGDVPTDTAGAFRRVMLIPASLAAGEYRLVAEAIDGDEVATLDVVVLAASAMAGMPDMPGMKHPAEHEGAEMPTGAPLELVRPRSAVVTATAIAVILACAFGGGLLLRRHRANSTESVS